MLTLVNKVESKPLSNKVVLDKTTKQPYAKQHCRTDKNLF